MFNVLLPIGKGGFGKVWKVEAKKGAQVYAMKEMSKAKIISKKSVTSVMNEKIFLAKLTHPFLVNMNCSFQDREHLYLIMDYLDGGDLRYHIGNRRYFNERETKFFIANILIGLQFLHKHKVIHRDIKPENLVLDSQGYLRITDLGISRELKPENSCDTSGTPGYMAP
jgi:serum/glucocorticoid-regulated kinase 2